MLHQETEGNLFRDLQSALDLVHGLNAVSTVCGGDVDRRRAGAAHFVIGVHGRMHRMEGNSAGAEPFRDLFHMLLAVGVIEVLAGGEDFDRLCPAPHQTIQQARMEPLLDVHVGGHGFQH
jgi:hypothetical protein